MPMMAPSVMTVPMAPVLQPRPTNNTPKTGEGNLPHCALASTGSILPRTRPDVTASPSDSSGAARTVCSAGCAHPKVCGHMTR